MLMNNQQPKVLPGNSTAPTHPQAVAAITIHLKVRASLANSQLGQEQFNLKPTSQIWSTVAVMEKLPFLFPLSVKQMVKEQWTHSWKMAKQNTTKEGVHNAKTAYQMLSKQNRITMQTKRNATGFERKQNGNLAMHCLYCRHWGTVKVRLFHSGVRTSRNHSSSYHLKRGGWDENHLRYASTKAMIGQSYLACVWVQKGPPGPLSRDFAVMPLSLKRLSLGIPIQCFDASHMY